MTPAMTKNYNITDRGGRDVIADVSYACTEKNCYQYKYYCPH